MGLDLLLEAAQRTDQDFVVHIVGGLSEAQKSELATDPRFVAHGYLEIDKVNELMARSTLGLCTFGIHRKKFTEGNTLKIREYLRAGLPVYSGHRDSFDDSFPYFRHGPADFDAMLKFAEQMRSVDRQTVSAEAKPIIDKKVVLTDIYEGLVEVMKNS